MYSDGEHHHSPVDGCMNGWMVGEADGKLEGNIQNNTRWQYTGTDNREDFQFKKESLSITITVSYMDYECIKNSFKILVVLIRFRWFCLFWVVDNGGI